VLKNITVAFTIMLSASAALAQRNSPPSAAELAEITERGRQLAEYDRAAWHATDSVLAMKPGEGTVARYIAKKADGRWTVAFGRINEKRDKFLIVYEAQQGASPTAFQIQKHDPPKEDTGFYYSAAKAVETVLEEFRGENRPYNAAVLPAKSNQIYVYVVPAQTRQGVYPLGGDVRYTVSADGAKVVERRQLHKAIIEFETSANTQAGFHVAVLDDVPEDTDVFHVLSRKPSVPHLIATRKYVYQVEVDGSIRYLGEAEKILGKR
jgi:hypothetical protein